MGLCASWPLRDYRNDFSVNLGVMKMGLKKTKTSTMSIPWHFDDIMVDVTFRQRHIIHYHNHC
jgi:hypothetical protein